MKVGDLVRFTIASWGTPVEDRPVGIVVRQPYQASTRASFTTLVDIRFSDDERPWPTDLRTLEVINENW